MFIVLEGIDIKGNTVLSSILNKRTPNSVALKENSDLALEMIKNPENAVEIFERLCEERVKLSNKIKEYLNSGKIVILDRYFPSSICCQIEVCRERGFDCKELVKVYQKYYPKWLKPDLVLILNTDLETCIKGIREMGYQQVDESILKKVKKCYDSLADLMDNVYYIKDEKDAFSIIRNTKSVKA
ncbi:MAG: deoxynucleoside kinase [Sulfurihydrogenibium sp.]|jgi:thymidylate kinase|nr:deoxynucleoside kinase [Sulfurihydrogenibium sp.]